MPSGQPARPALSLPKGCRRYFGGNGQIRTLTRCTEFLTILRLVPYLCRNIFADCHHAGQLERVNRAQYFEEVMTEGSLAALWGMRSKESG